MKICLTVLFCLCVLVGCGKKGEVGLKKEATLTPETKTKKTDVQMHGFKGQVRSVKVRDFKIEENSGNLVRTEGPIQSTLNYDEKGNSVGDTLYYSANGKIYSSYTYKYDERGNMVERVHNKPNGKVKGKTIYKYDEKGNRVEMLEYDGTGVPAKTTFKYDEKENRVEIMWNDGGTAARNKTTLKYDEKGNMTEWVDDNLDGYLRNTTYKYDEKGNRVELVECDSSGKITRKNIRKYDEKGNKVEEEEYDGSGKIIFKSTFECDDKGNTVKETTFMVKTDLGESHLVPVSEEICEYTYWD